ncbi:MAG: glycosyltransferase family 4 protein [Candidatus Nanopelagicales bacterium]|nr:glycosyltransferase family 4 protein [Candidatus Nanopelagicales bacterium]
MLSPIGEVVHISDCFAPRTGGIETQVGNLVVAQRQAGLSVRVITATTGGSLPGVQRVTAPIPFGLPVHPRTRHALVQALSNNRPGVVHIHMGATSPFAWGAVRAVRELNIPTVITVHSMWGALSRFGYHSARSWLQGPPIIWSAVSDQAAVFVAQALGVPVSIMPNGISVDSWATQASSSPHLRVIGVMRMAPRKRVTAWLSIIGQVQRRHPEVSATLVGSGPLLTYAQKYSHRHGINVEFRGRLDHSQLTKEFADSDVFLQASIQESFGIAALEARAAGLVVLARAETGTASFIDSGISGFLEESDAGLVNRLGVLAQQPDMVAAIKQHNQTPPSFDWSRLVDISHRLYVQAQRTVN